MRIDLPFGLRAVILFCLTAALIGCSGEPRVQCFPVTGRIQFKEPPGHRVVVIFNPVQGRKAVPIVPSGDIGPDGTFSISTYGDGDGAPAGDYRLTLLIPMEEREKVSKAAKSLQEKYADPNRPVATFQVREGNNEVPVIKLN